MKNEIMNIVEQNADRLQALCKECAGGAFVPYVSEGGRIATKLIDGWETYAVIFGGIVRAYEAHKKITAKIVCQEARFQLEGHDGPSPAERLFCD